MEIHVITLFPEMFPGVLDTSILGHAQRSGAIAVRLHQLRDHAEDRHRTVDDRPFGGGPGMVLKPEPVYRAVEAIEARAEDEGKPRPLRVLLTPAGERFDQRTAERLADVPAMTLICGHYEGFDERIRVGLRPLEISVGDFVLTGGEIPAMLIIDAVARLVPGVLGDARSAADDSFSSGRLECPHYTRPAEFRGMRVPAVLRTGDHARVDAWRELRSSETTRARRRDLLDRTPATETPIPDTDAGGERPTANARGR